MTTYLSRTQILAAPDLPREAVHVPEWGGDVLVRGLTARERDEYEQALLGDGVGSGRLNFANARARLIAFCVVDGAGERLFTDDDVGELGQKSAAAVDRLFSVAARLSALRADDVDRLVGNSVGGGGGGSSSPSP